MKYSRRWASFRYVPHARIGWYLARGWVAIDLGHYHGQYSVGMFKKGKMKDIFGNEVDSQALMDAPLIGKKKRKPTLPRGHYFTPGTGPAGETCGSCKHMVRVQCAKVYRKCELARSKWTGGPASDIRAKDAACKFWEKGTPK